MVGGEIVVDEVVAQAGECGKTEANQDERQGIFWFFFKMGGAKH